MIRLVSKCRLNPIETPRNENMTAKLPELKDAAAAGGWVMSSGRKLPLSWLGRGTFAPQLLAACGVIQLYRIIIISHPMGRNNNTEIVGGVVSFQRRAFARAGLYVNEL